jgi:hypothetical protein
MPRILRFFLRLYYIFKKIFVRHLVVATKSILKAFVTVILKRDVQICR